MTRKYLDPRDLDICDSDYSDFIPLRDGFEFIRKSEILGLRWEYFSPGDADPANTATKSYRLRVFLNECPSLIVYGDDATTVMRSLELPEKHPD